MFQATGAARNWLKPCSYGELALRGRRSRGWQNRDDVTRVWHMTSCATSRARFRSRTRVSGC